MDLSTTYMGLKLANPLVPSASPLSEEIDNIKRMEDAGASAVVLYSLFEEQLSKDRLELYHHMTNGSESFAESLTYFPEPPEFHLGPEGYLDHIRRAKEAVNIPIIASLNGGTIGGWTDFAKRMEQAGADAIELNIYYLPADLQTPGHVVEQNCIDILKAVKSSVTIPVAIKLSAFYSSMANMAYQLDQAGADGLVLFNRFYQPDIDLDQLEVVPNVLLSRPQALRLPLRWVAILYGRILASLAATSGIHEAADVIKMLMAGANVTMMCAALLRNGIDHLRTVQADMRSWMEAHEYESVRQMQGSMSHAHCEDPAAFERVQYMKALQSIPPID
ncbi:MAG: dihydroorotate dehydrogenase-like protein [candidate division Zixibacteria bacterium]|nr:dihydroorotate dehydrogenase-like protein [candidate division Zixibacteria bacterium]